MHIYRLFKGYVAMGRPTLFSLVFRHLSGFRVYKLYSNYEPRPNSLSTLLYELEPITTPHRPDLKAYKVIRSYCEVFIPLEKRPKVYKVKARCHDPCRDMRVSANGPRLMVKTREKAIRTISFNRTIQVRKAIKRNHNNRYGNKS